MKTKYIGILLIGVALSGCGGSGSSSSVPTSTAPKVAITSTNQSTITNTAINSATSQLASNSSLSIVGGVQTSTTPSNDPVLTQWADFAFNHIANQQNMPAGVAGAVTSYNCGSTAASGTYTVDTDNTTYITFTFNSCVLGSSTTNGTMSLSGVSITKNTAGVITAISANFSFDLTTVTTTTSGSVTYKLVGGFNIAATGIKTTSRKDSISGTTLSASVGTKYATLSNFSFTSTYDNTTTTPSTSSTIDYTYASDLIAAAFDFHTVNALVKNYFDTYPRSGQVIISGANSTAVKVTVVSTDANAGTSTGTVQLQLSSDGGATYGTAVTKTWAQIAAGL
jgi:hypothetical protein